MSLIDEAAAFPVQAWKGQRRKPLPVYPEEIEQLAAYLHGDVTQRQIVHALGYDVKKGNGSTGIKFYSWFHRTCKAALVHGWNIPGIFIKQGED